MYSVQIEQLLPQPQAMQLSSAQDTNTGNSSFLDMLRSSGQELQKEEHISAPPPENHTQETNAEYTQDSKSNEKVSVAKKHEPSAIDDEEKDQETVKGNDILILSLDGSEKYVVQQINADGSDDEGENFSLQNDPSAQKTHTSFTVSQLEWLEKSPPEEYENESVIAGQSLERLLDNTAEIALKDAGDEEVLESAINLSVDEPEQFLDKVSNTVEMPGVKIKTPETAALDKKNSKKDIRLDVTDLRTQDATKPKTEEPSVARPEKVYQKKELNLSYKRENENTFQVSLDLSNAAKQNITSSSGQASSATSSVFQSMLSNAVQENALEFVRAGNIILKDNNQGNINLIVHPEKLGNVKISLSLSDKIISGSITVHSEEAYNAMKDSIAELKSAFSGSGFETGEFNLHFEGDGQNFAQNQSGYGQNQQSDFMASHVYGDYVSLQAQGADTEALLAFSSGADYSVNIVA